MRVDLPRDALGHHSGDPGDLYPPTLFTLADHDGGFSGDFLDVRYRKSEPLTDAIRTHHYRDDWVVVDPVVSGTGGLWIRNQGLVAGPEGIQALEVENHTSVFAKAMPSGWHNTLKDHQERKDQNPLTATAG